MVEKGGVNVQAVFQGSGCAGDMLPGGKMDLGWTGYSEFL